MLLFDQFEGVVAHIMRACQFSHIHNRFKPLVFLERLNILDFKIPFFFGELILWNFDGFILALGSYHRDAHLMGRLDYAWGSAGADVVHHHVPVRGSFRRVSLLS